MNELKQWSNKQIDLAIPFKTYSIYNSTAIITSYTSFKHDVQCFTELLKWNTILYKVLMYLIHLANRLVHSEASSSCLFLSAKYKWAIPGTRGLSAKKTKELNNHIDVDKTTKK